MNKQDPTLEVLQDNIPVFWIQTDGTVFWNDGKKKRQCKTNKDLSLAFVEAMKVFIHSNTLTNKGIYHVTTDTLVSPITTKKNAEEQCATCPSCGEMTHLEGHNEEGQYYQSQCNNGTCNKFGMTQKFPYTTPSTL